jgi:hypothetical protein
MGWLTAIAIAFAGLWAAPANAGGLTGNELRQLCTQSPAECLGYVRAVADLLAQSGCGSEVEAFAITLYYLRQHPSATTPSRSSAMPFNRLGAVQNGGLIHCRPKVSAGGGHWDCRMHWATD